VALGAWVLIVHAASIASVAHGPMTEPLDDQNPQLTGPILHASGNPLDRLRELVLDVADELLVAPDSTGEQERGKGRAQVTLERPRRVEFGDYSTNAALLLAPRVGAPPRELAQRLGEALQVRLGAELEHFEVAGPGFLNLFLADSWLREALSVVLADEDRFGAGQAARSERILIEFVSANPTGPMHVGHARNAAYGDALARMLEYYGHSVEREFYVNDAGSQIQKFGESIQALARGEQVAEDGYQGEYVIELAREIEGAATIAAEEVGRAGLRIMLEQMRDSLSGFGVGEFARWFGESSLYEGDPSAVTRTLAVLAEQGHSFERDGALWLRTTDFGDDKDRVLLRSNGEPTYFASDTAYHQDKRERGFERQIDVWGADHHGYVLRTKAAYAALGGDPQELELLIMQLVHLMRSGERAQMSKRSGQFVTLEELVEEIGVDAARWYLLARSHDTTVDLDLDLAREQSKENPVYYVQYAHARIASMLAKAGAERVREASAADLRGIEHPLHQTERMLIEQLLAFPGELNEAVERRAPHRLAAYVLELAQGFTSFYSECRVLGVEPQAVESLRLALCSASMRTIASALAMLGVSAPQEM
jgi:arginyl-tRNA synthetase